MCHYYRQIVFAVHILYATFDIVLRIDAQHKSCLVKPDLIVSRHLYLSLEFTPVVGIIKGASSTVNP